MRPPRALAPRNLGILRSSLQPKPTRPALPFVPRLWQLPQCRLYSIPHHPRKLDERPSPQKQTGISDKMFRGEDVPSISFWKSAEKEGPQDLRAEDYYRTATLFCQVAPRKPTNWQWKGRLESDYGIDVYKMYWTAVVMLSNTPTFFKLPYALLETASDLNYAPATISIVRFLLLSLRNGPRDPMFKTAGGRFVERLNMLARAGHPDALTVQGHIRYLLEDYRGALQSLSLAIKSGNSGGDVYAPVMAKQEVKTATGEGHSMEGQRRPKWSTEAACHLDRGRVLVQVGDRTAAEASFRTAALELDSPTAYLELGKLLPMDSTERGEFLLKAVVSGNLDACVELAHSCMAKSLDGGVSQEEKKDLELWAAEWLSIGGLAERAEATTQAPANASR